MPWKISSPCGSAKEALIPSLREVGLEGARSRSTPAGADEYGGTTDRFDRRIDPSEAAWWDEIEAVLPALVLVPSRVTAPE